MLLQRLKRITAYMLILSITLSFMPSLAFAASAESEVKKEEIKTAETVTKDDVIEKTEDQTTYDLGGGKQMTVLYGGEVRYLDDNGKLRDYDASLVKINEGEKSLKDLELKGYSVRNNKGDTMQYLPSRLSEDTPILMENDKYNIKMTMSDETLRMLDVTSDILVSEEKLPDIYDDVAKRKVNAKYESKDKKTSITYTSGEHGVKEEIKLQERPKSNVIEYVLNIGDLKAKKNPDAEGITIYDEEKEEIIAGISKSWMNDATEDAYSENIKYELSEDSSVKGRYILKMILDEEYLDSKDRKYPITIDPELTWLGPSSVKDVYVISGSYQNTNFFSSSTVVMPVGQNSTGTHMTYIKFTNLQSSVSGKNVSEATLSGYEVSGSENGQKISAYRVGGAWSESSITFNNKPALVGSAMSTITTQPAAVEHKFNILSYVKGVADGTNADYGVALKNTSSSPSYVALFGSRSSSTAYRPKLKITYSVSEVPTTATTASLSPKYVTDLSKTKLSFSGITAPSLARVEYRAAKYNDEEGTVGDTAVPYSEATAITTGSNLKDTEEGCYRIFVRGVNSAGVAGEEKSAGEVHVDKTAPDFSKATIQDNEGNDISTGVTKENNPLISFSGVTDRHIEKACIKYAIVEKGVSPESSDFKVPSNLNISDSKPYSGSFRLTDAEKGIESGDYEIFVRVSDLAGNTKTKKLRFCKDNKAPSGSIKIEDPMTGLEISSLSEPAKLEVRVDGTGSKITKGILKLYKIKKDASGNDVIDEDSEVLISKDLEISENIIFDTLDICDSYGKYRLALHLEDEAGLTFDTTKDFDVVYILPAADKAEIEGSRGGTSCIKYEFPYTHNQKVKLKKIEAKFDNETSFHTIVEASDGEVLPFSGEAVIEVPNGEGEHTVTIRGVSQYGHNGTEYQTKCVVDRTNPVANMTMFDQGLVMGSVTDTNLKEWKIYAKPKNETEYQEEPVGTGTREVNQYWLAFIDLNQEVFQNGTEYTLKLVACDKAGNEAEATYDIAIPSDESLIPRIVEPEIEIDKGRNNLNYGGFILGTNTERLEIKNGVTGADWYINNRKANNEILTLPEDVLFKDWWNSVLAVKKESDGSRKYSAKTVLNGSKQEVYLSGTQEESFFFSQDSVVSFRITATPGVATYKIKAQTMGEGEYKDVEVGRTYYITDFTDDQNAFASMFNVLATANPGKDLSNANLVVHCDTVGADSFLYTDVENYAPKNLSVADKINYKTYLKWDIPYELPDNVSYSVYRGTSEDFTANEETLVAENLKTGSYLEINTLHGKDFYYKVCAVKSYVDPGGMQAKTQSSFTEIAASRTTDSNEYLKRIGIKEYWDFAEFNTPCGNGYIEKSKGNFLYKQKDAELGNEGTEVSLDRAYNSAASSKGMFGTGWNFEYDMELLNICENNSMDFLHVVLKDENGTIYHFTRNSGESEFVSSLGSYVNLEAENAEETKTVFVSGEGEQAEKKIKYKFTLSKKDGDTYYFNTQGQLVFFMDVSDNFIIFNRNDKGMLSEMTTKENIQVEFIYNDESTKEDPLTVKEVRLPDGAKLLYEYKRPTFSSDVLLKKVTEVYESESVSYEYDYDKSLLGSDQRNLTKIKDATGQYTYKLEYDYGEDKVKSAIYPDGEKISFKYSDDDSNTVMSKYSDGEIVSCEKDYFDRVSGRIEKYIEGDTLDQLTEENEDAEVTTYTYKNNQVIKIENTNEYFHVEDDGSISKESDIKVADVEYDGDNPSKEREEDGSVTEYTYYDETDGAHLDGQIKTMKEFTVEGKLVSYRKYSYDQSGNILEDIDYISKAKAVFTYYTEGTFKGEVKEEKEYKLTVSDSYEVTDSVLQSTSDFTYEYIGEGQDRKKVEGCTQTLPKPDGGNEVISTAKTYDVMGRLLSETDSRGYETTYTYDGLGRNTSATVKYEDTEALKKSSERTYDANGSVIYEKTEDGIENFYTYDNMQRVISVRSKKGDLDETINTSYSYEDVDIYCGKGSKTVHVDKAYVTRTKYQDGTLISESYEDNDGNVVRSYVNGRYTDMTYTKAGELLSKWSMGKTISSDNGVLSLYIYDNRGDLTSTITDAGYEEGVSNTGYKLKTGSIVTKSTYDSEGNVLSSTDPLGHVTNYTYDKEGNLTSLLTATNSLYEYKYDQNGDNGTVKDVVISPREFGTAFDRTTSKSIYVKDVSGKTIEIQDHGTSEYDDSVIRTKYEYDLRDNLSKSTEGNGNYKIYSYDQRDRVTKVSSYEKTESSAKHTLSTTYTYDDRDNVLSMIDYEVSEDGEETIYHYTAYTYDGFNRLTSVAELNTSEIPSDEAIEAKKIKYEYNGKDRLVSISYPNDVSRKISGLKFEYDSFGYVTKIFASFKQGPDKLLRTYTYTDKYQIDEILEYTDPLSGDTNPLKRKYVYDKLGRVTGIEYLKGIGSEPKEANYYEYDKCNNITKERSLSSYSKENEVSYEVIKEHSYTADGKLTKTDVTEKDEAGTVTKETTITYTYDAAGNMLTEQSSGSKVESTTMTYNEFDQLTNLVSKDANDTVRSNRGYVYDGSGNRIKETDSVTLNEVISSYDSENRLKKVESKTGGTLDYTQVNKYNGSGQRIEKTEGSSVTNYYYDGTKVLYTEDENKDITSFNMIGLNGNILSTERRDGDTESYYSYIVDIRGSTINLLGGNGVSEVSYEYDDYGETVKHDRDEENPIFNEVCYTGGIYDETTGLYNLNARFYDAETNSFISQDTYRGNRAEPSSINLYSYCEGDPISYQDPSGHWVSTVIWGALGAYDGYKYAKKKGLTGWKKAAAIAGGALLGAVDPFKVAKSVKTGYKAYKAVKVTKAASTAKKTTVVAKVVTKKPKPLTTIVKTLAKSAKPKNVKKQSAALKKVTKKTKNIGCFTKGTKVSTKNGFKAIDQIKVGDHVWSENPETNEKALKKVKKIFVREKDSIIRLSINGETIETTDEHPFYLEGYGFVSAKSLEVGDYVRTQDGISEVEEAEKILLDAPINVYNIEVEDYHTYYVSEAKVLVHNTCALDPIKAVKTKAEVIWSGKPHGNKTPGHWETIVSKTQELQNSGEYSKIYINKGLRNEVKSAKRNRRPDIMAVRHDGTIDQFEIPSKTDVKKKLIDRMEENAQMLGNRAGKRELVDILK